MMDESDEDFKELCASFFQRVKKNAPREVSGERKTQNACSSTQKRSKLKNPSQAATKSKTLQNSSEKKPPSGSHVPRTKKQATTKSRKGEPAVSVNEEGGVLIPAPDQPVLCGRAPSIQTESAPNGNSQPPPSCFTVTAVPSPSKPRASKLVVQRMQQFKRADPERLRHASEESSLKTALEENCPRSPQEEIVLGNGSKPKLPTIDSDAAVALALQQEFGQDGASARDDSLEEKGLFFCQICQKNLSAMNVTRREQHVNRCLDESEKALRPAIPQIPDCPICGKPFLTAKSRISHLKQCAVKMEVGPQLLLQAVRLQTAQPSEDGSPQAPSFSNHVGGLKRKGATNKKEPQKRRKVNRPEAPSEDVLVAMALSRSEMEQCPAVPTLSWESAFSGKIKLKAEKKPRKKKPLVCPPQLLVQDSETTGRQLEDLVAQLLSEEMELSSTPPLPASRISKGKSGEASWHLQLPKGKRNFLWEGSALTGAWAKESFYTAGLVPLVVSQWPPKEPELPLALPKQPEPPALHRSPPVGQIPRNQLLSSSQREHQALQDLVDLAEEGLSASSWPGSLQVPTGLDLVPSSPPLTGFILPSTEKPLKRGGHDSLSLKLLVADFGAMVNNPHLSDIQFQTDGGEVFYAHKFVLYARCPLLIQYVNTDGFSAAEDGDLTHRILLHDVSSEAAHAFLNYLYMADTDLPPSLAPDLRSLALRFGVHDLLHLCEQVPVRTDLEGELQEEEEDENCKNRAENFQELLRSMWVDEEEEAETLLKSDVCEEDREKVNEAEMEEIYEFAATQRKQLQAERAASVGEDACQLEGVSPVARPALAGVQGNSQLEKAEQMESSKLGKEETPTSWGNARHSFLLLQGQCSDGIGEVETKKQEAPREAAGHPSSCSPSGSPEARCKKGSLLPPVKTHDYKQPFASTQREFSELSQITVDHKQLSDPVRERQVEMSHPSSPEQAPPSSPRCLLSQSPIGGSPSQSCLHLYPTSDLSPSVSQSHSGISKVTSPRSPAPLTPAKQRRNSSVLTLLREPGHQKGKRVSSMSEHKNRGILISPAKSPPIDLTQSVPDHMSPKTQDPPCHVKKEDEIILLLDSDEELELEHTKTKLVSNDSSEERKVLEVSPRSPELFSVIDIDEDQEHFQSSPKREAELQKEEAERQQEGQAAFGGRELPWLFCQQNSTDEDSSRDASWLVPATPLSSRSRDCSAQTQITSLKTRTPADETAQVTARASLEHRTVQDTAQKFSVIMPQALAITPGTSDSSRQGFITPGTLDSSRQAYGSPAHSYPGCHKLSSPQPSCPLPDLARRIQKLSLPGPCLPNQAGADEVVEVGDSDDEQEMACHQGNSSSLPNGDPPIPMADCCWHVEPLSPIPIDHLNLERTGPLSTSSPSSQAQEALHDSDSRSPGLLGTTPIRGSCAAQRDSQEQSLWAGSPGNSKLSFLNPALWDDWDEDDQNSPEAAPAVQTPSARAQNPEEPETPKGANKKKNLPPKVPITPMPRYSIMETPVLKKELDRFGVRALPKRQMVLKLKEIFQYTHQTLESDSEDEIQSSQVSPGVPCSQAPATRTNKHSRSRGYTQLQTTAGLGTQRSKGPTKTKDPQHQKKQLSESIPHPSRSPAGELPPGPDDDAQLPASQEPMVISVDGSDSSFGSQSSSHEFGSALESAGEDEEGEEGVSASQAALTEETVRRYICSKPALYQKVLMYQPLELAELQAELKQDGIHVAMGKLLDILDAQCITFTTAAARKEKLKQKRRKNFGRKKKVRE